MQDDPEQPLENTLAIPALYLDALENPTRSENVLILPDPESPVKITVEFSADEWRAIKYALEDVRAKLLNRQEVERLAVLHCRSSLKSLVVLVNPPPQPGGS